MGIGPCRLPNPRTLKRRSKRLLLKLAMVLQVIYAACSDFILANHAYTSELDVCNLTQGTGGTDGDAKRFRIAFKGKQTSSPAAAKSSLMKKDGGAALGSWRVVAHHLAETNSCNLHSQLLFKQLYCRIRCKRKDGNQAGDNRSEACCNASSPTGG